MAATLRDKCILSSCQQAYAAHSKKQALHLCLILCAQYPDCIAWA